MPTKVKHLGSLLTLTTPQHPKRKMHHILKHLNLRSMAKRKKCESRSMRKRARESLKSSKNVTLEYMITLRVQGAIGRKHHPKLLQTKHLKWSLVSTAVESSGILLKLIKSLAWAVLKVDLVALKESISECVNIQSVICKKKELKLNKVSRLITQTFLAS